MQRDGNFVRYTADELSKLKSETDWAKADTMTREEIERQAETDDGPLPEGWEDTVVLGAPGRKRGVYLRLDPDVLEWFRHMAPAIRRASMPCFEPLFRHGRSRSTWSGSPNNRAVSNVSDSSSLSVTSSPQRPWQLELLGCLAPASAILHARGRSFGLRQSSSNPAP
jgi:uncharacterized protein (DUF4415 family)